MKKTTIIKAIQALLLFAAACLAQTAPTIEWARCYGGSNGDYAWSIQQTSDGGFIVAGESRSNDGDVTGNHGRDDYWVVKLSPETGIAENALPEQFSMSITPNPFNSAVSITAPSGGNRDIRCEWPACGAIARRWNRRVEACLDRIG